MSVDAPSPGDFLRAMLRHKLVIVAGTALAAGVAALACALLPPTYEASAVLEKVEKDGLLESIRSVGEFHALVAESAVLEHAIAQANAAPMTPRALLASTSARPSSTPNAMEIAVRHPSPETAAALANALARLGIEAVTRARRAVYDVRRRVLEGRLARLNAELVGAEREFSKWLVESQVDLESLELDDLHQTIRKLRETAALLDAEENARRASDGQKATASGRLEALQASIARLNSELRARTFQQTDHAFEKERRYARYLKRREANSAAEQAYAEYLAQADPNEPELMLRTDARAPAAPTRASDAAIIVSSAIAGFAASAFVAMVLGFRPTHA